MGFFNNSITQLHIFHDNNY